MNVVRTLDEGKTGKKSAYFDLYECDGRLIRSLKPELGGPSEKKVREHYERICHEFRKVGEDQ